MRSLKRALSVVSAISQSHIGLSLQDLATQLDVPAASMHRLLATLEDEEMVVRSPSNRRYFIGPSAMNFESASVRSRRLQQIPPGPLARAAIISGQTVFLTEMIELKAVCVALAPGRRAGILHVVLGREMPLHAASSARILLLDAADAQIVGLLDGMTPEPCAGPAPTSPQEVLSRVQLARRRGYDVCDNELDLGKWSVSAPVRDAMGRIRQGVTLVADSGRTRRQGTRENLIRLTRQAAAELSAPARAGKQLSAVKHGHGLTAIPAGAHPRAV
ncbi:MAG: IclR family transcriptional regulator [Nocardia sp.]|uniref:IclR family transcriptional regulator n=1 Tax=Nocardia sp. TaxID=1821 RepID=UPI002602D0D6|nr:IclR family transcriptional regulator [Nocardia sp.]MCU1640735.1 IclR family transcriptional regulator [Nocardia sp.]